MTGDLLVHNIGELCTLRGGPRRGRAMGDLSILRDAAVAIRDGRVADVGPTERVAREWGDADAVLDAGGRAVVPGFVDSHTHPVFAGERSHELALKLQGKSYQEIAEAGGGILHTVRETRRASRDALTRLLLERLDVMLAHGTTTVEAKSGYGLDAESEVASLEAVRDADARHAVDLVPTLLAAHAVPPEFSDDPDGYVDAVVEEITPAAAGLAEFVDAFCEEGWFTVPQSRRVLEAGVAHGLTPKVHADELARSGGSQLAASVRAVSADHLLHASEADVAAMVKAGVTPVLLPATALTLNAPAADGRAMVDAGAPVAIATDFNPNCWCPSMPYVIGLACHLMRLTPAEALTAATANAAAALGRGDTHGSLEAGKAGDLVVLDAPSHVHLAYQLGTNPVRQVVKGGEVVVDRAAGR